MAVKVCHLTSVHITFDNRIFHKECGKLHKAGYEVHLVAGHDRDEVVDGIHIHTFGKRSGGRLRRMTLNLLDLVRVAIKIDAQIYHLHDSELLGVGLFLKLMGKKVVFDSHENTTASIQTKEWIPAPIRRIVAVFYGMFERFALIFMDRVISAHPDFTSKVKDSVPLYNYPELSKFQNINFPAASNGKFLWLGLLSKGRGAYELKDAVTIDSDLIIDVIGPSGKFDWEHDRINFLGKFSVDEAYRMSAGYVAGLVTFLPEPNNINSSANKIFEYMALGIPIISSDTPGRRGLIEELQSGLCVDPTKPEEIAKAMRFMLDNPDKAKEMGANGRKAVLGKYNWENESKILLDLYQSVISLEED